MAGRSCGTRHKSVEDLDEAHSGQSSGTPLASLPSMESRRRHADLAGELPEGNVGTLAYAPGIAAGRKLAGS